MRRLHIIILLKVLMLHIFRGDSLFSAENDESADCVVLSKECAEARIKEVDDLSYVFRDVIYYYCLDLYRCLEGKNIVCQHVRPTDQEYIEKSHRKRVLDQCREWNITTEIGFTAVDESKS